MFVTAKALWEVGQAFAFPMPEIPEKHLTLLTFCFSSMWGKSVHLLSETSAVDLGDGVWGHGTPNARAGRRTLRYWSDAIRRILAGRGEGCITGNTKTVVCGTKVKPDIKKNNKKNKPIKCIKTNIGTTKYFPLDNKELPSPSWETGSRVRSSVNCRPSSPCSSWPEDSCSTLVLPFFPSRSFKIIYGNKIYMEWQKQKHLKTFASSKISIPIQVEVE